MPVFVNEPLAGPAGANLSGLPTGATKHAGATADLVLSNANPRLLRGSSNQTARYVYAQQAPPTADWDVAGTTTRRSGLGEWGFMVRCDPTANTYYFAGYVQSAAAWQLQRVVAGAQAVLASQAQAWANGETKGWRVRVRGTNPVALEILDAQNGPANTIVTVQDVAATRITAAGRVGVRINAGTTSQFENRGYHVGSFQAAGAPPAQKPVGPQAPPGPHLQRVLATPLPEQAAEQARIVTEVVGPGPLGWAAERGGVAYEIVLPQGVQEQGGVLVIPEVAVTPAPPPGVIPPSPPHRFVNPPLHVEDGTVSEGRGPQGHPLWVPNIAEDPEKSFREWVVRLFIGGPE